MIIFTVPGRVQGKARARTFFNSKANKVVSVTPTQTVSYENWIKTRFIQAKPNDFKVIEGPVLVDIKAMYRKAKGNKMSMPCLKPDADNCIKSVLDSLNGIAYIDDKQVVAVTLRKFFGEPEGLEITIQEITEDKTA